MSKYSKNKVKYRPLRLKFYMQDEHLACPTTETEETNVPAEKTLRSKLYLRPKKTKVILRISGSGKTKIVFRPNRDLNIELLSPLERDAVKTTFVSFFKRAEVQQIRLSKKRAVKVLKSVPACLMMSDNETIDSKFVGELNTFKNKLVNLRTVDVAQKRNAPAKVGKKTTSYDETLEDVLRDKKELVNRYMRAIGKEPLDTTEAKKREKETEAAVIKPIAPVVAPVVPAAERKLPTFDRDVERNYLPPRRDEGDDHERT